MNEMEIDHIPDDDELAGLPESQRIVTKILEYDILDPVWFQVLRNHPELQVRSDGKQVELSRNHNLRYHINSVSNISLDDYHSDIQSIDEFITTIDLNGNFSVKNITDLHRYPEAVLSLRQGNPVSCPQASLPPLPGAPVAATAPPSVSEPFPASHFITKALFIDSCSSLAIDETTEGKLFRKGRQVVLGLDLVVEAISPDAIAAAQKAAKGKKDAPPIDLKPKKTLKYRVIIIDLFANLLGQVKIEKVHDFYLDGAETDYEQLDINFALHNFINMDIAEDGRLLSIVVNTSSVSLCQIYDTAEPKQFSQGNKSEDTPISPRTQAAVTTLLAPALVSYWRQARSDGDDRSTALVKRLLIVTEKDFLLRNRFEKYVTDAQRAAHAQALAELEASKPKPSILKKDDPPPEPVPPAKGTAAGKGAPVVVSAPPISPRSAAPLFVALRKDFYPSIRILAIINAIPLVVIYRLAVKPEEPPKPIDPKAKPADKSKGAVETPFYPHMLCPCVPYEEQRWRLTDTITAWSFFGSKYSREYIAFGTLDGVLSIWDVRRNQIVASLGRHPASITSISAIYDNYSSCANVLSGSLDGTVTLYSNRPGGNNSGSNETGEDNALLDYFYVPTPLFSMKLINYRYDAHKYAVVQTKILIVKNSTINDSISNSGDGADTYLKRYLGLVQYTNGVTGIYDCSNLQPMASLARDEKLNYEPQPSLFIASDTVPKRRYIFIDPEPDPALVEPVPIPAKGKGPAVPEPVAEPAAEEPKQEVMEKEKVADRFPEVEVLKTLINQGCNLEAFAHINAMSVAANSLLTINERVENPVISVFDMMDALENHIKRINEPTGFQFNISPQLAGTSKRAPSITASNVSKVSRVKGIPSTSGSTTFKALPKLTEELLQEHDQHYDSVLRKPSGWSSFEAKIKKSELMDYDPQVLVKQELLELKKERIAGKLKLNKTINALISVIGEKSN